MSKRNITLAVAGLAALLASTAFSTTDRREMTAERLGRDPAASIEALDYCIQRRLHDFEGFGLSRLVDVPQHLDRFEPETSDESAAVARLRDSGRVVAIFLGGRGLLDPARDADKEPLGARTFSPPVDVTGTGGLTLPAAAPLRALGRKALAASPAGEAVAGAVGRWRIDVRPVRADRQACIDCHAPRTRDLRIGDALGVVVYASTDR